MSSERPQDDGVMLVHAKTSADAQACRREHHPRRSDLTKLHAVDSSSQQRCYSSNLCSVTSRVKHLRAAGIRRVQGDPLVAKGERARVVAIYHHRSAAASWRCRSTHSAVRFKKADGRDGPSRR
jgi:hypothetical protein